MNNEWEREWNDYLHSLDDYKYSLAHRACQLVFYSSGLNSVMDTMQRNPLWSDHELRRLLKWLQRNMDRYRQQVKHRRN